MNHERCAALHNEIVRVGLEGCAQTFDPATLHSFWDTLSEYHDQLEEQLKPSIIDFYKKAFVHPRQYEIDFAYQNFFYFVRELHNPLQEGYYRTTLEAENQDAKENDDDPDRYLLFYIATNLESHEMGIVFDQIQCKAAMKMSLWSGELEHSNWQPLENILEGYLNMINMGKVTALNTKANEYQISRSDLSCANTDPYPPWIVHSASTRILERTLRALDRLIGSIEVRMPPAEHINPQSCTASHLATEAELVQGNLPKRGFVHDFLLQAFAPAKPIRYIAPGIRLPDHESLTNQPFRAVGNQYPNADDVREAAERTNTTYSREDLEQGATWMPIHLFPGDCIDDEYLVPLSTREEPFQWPYQGQLPRYPCGLWIRGADTRSNQPYEDETLLVLPFKLGLPGLAKSTEGRPIEPASRTALYQMDMNPFVENHGTQLYLILENWSQRVESGDWIVDENGVAGGIEKFKDADQSEELSKQYCVSLSW